MFSYRASFSLIFVVSITLYAILCGCAHVAWGLL